MKNVPVDAFWSIAVYDINGFIFDGSENFSINSYVGEYTFMGKLYSFLAKPNADGSHTIRFSNTKGENTLDIGEGWNYLIRFYEPKRELLSGEWEIPKPQPIIWAQN